MYARRAMSIFALSKAFYFLSLTAYPGEIAYFSSPNRELSDAAELLELY